MRFRRVLKAVLSVGNALNTVASSQRVVRQISLQSLLKLPEVPCVPHTSPTNTFVCAHSCVPCQTMSFDRTTSVLHFVVSTLQRSDPDALRVGSDLSAVPAVAV